MTDHREDRPVILLHGWTMQGTVFDQLATTLGPRAIAPDLPGHGTAAQTPAGLAACVEMLDQLIRDTGRRDVLLLGWSMGALVAWSYIASHGCARLSGLVTADMSPRPANDADWQLGLNGLTPARQQATTAEIHRDWPTAAGKIAATMFATPDGAPSLSRADAQTQVMANDPAIMARYWDEMMATDLRHVAAQVTVPWLITHGARSRVYPAATANWLAHHAPQAQVQSFASSGHSPHLEEPETFASALKQFEVSL